MTSFPLSSVISVALCFIKKSSLGSSMDYVLVGNVERTNARTSIQRTKSRTSLQLPTRIKRSAPSMSLSTNDSTKRACRKMGGEKFQNAAFAYYLSPPHFSTASIVLDSDRPLVWKRRVAEGAETKRSQTRPFRFRTSAVSLGSPFSKIAWKRC
jgi:hypothetical protein